MKVKVFDLTWDQFIYPRGNKSEKTISAYVEALAIGAQFPPVKIQRVFRYPNGNKTTKAAVIVDGVHRWSAFKESGIKEIEIIEWKENSLDYEKSKIALLIESAKCNTSHGDRLSPNDKKRIARDIASTDPACPPSLSLRRGGRECKYTESALAKKLGVSQQTVNAWITDIRSRQRKQTETVLLSA